MAQFDNQEDDDLLGKILAQAQASAAPTGEIQPSDKEALPSPDQEEVTPQPKDIDASEQKDASKEIEDMATSLEDNQPEEKASDKVAEPATLAPEKPAEEPPWIKLQKQAEQAFGKYKGNLEGQRLADLSTLPGRYLLGMKEPESLGKANEALASMPVASLEGTNNFLKSGLDVQQLKEANDANSDISKFARQQAESLLKRLNPNADTTILKGMTAANLEKLGLTKGMGSMMGRTEKTDYVTHDSQNPENDGHPIGLDNISGQMKDLVTGQPYNGSVRRSFQPTFIDPQSGERVAFNPLAPQGGQLASLTGPQKGPSSSNKNSSNQPGPLVSPKQLNTEDRKRFQKVSDSLEKSKEYTEATASISGAQELKELLKQGDLNGKDLMQAAAIKAIRAAGLNRITQQEILSMEGGSSILDEINRFRSKKLEGKISDSDRQLLNQYADIEQSSAKKRLNLALGSTADRLSTELGIDRPSAVNLLSAGSQLNRRPAISNLPPVKPGFVRMIAPDNTVHDVPEKNKEASKQKYQFQEYNQ